MRNKLWWKRQSSLTIARGKFAENARAVGEMYASAQRQFRSRERATVRHGIDVKTQTKHKNKKRMTWKHTYVCMYWICFEKPIHVSYFWIRTTSEREGTHWRYNLLWIYIYFLYWMSSYICRASSTVNVLIKAIDFDILNTKKNLAIMALFTLILYFVFLNYLNSFDWQMDFFSLHVW